VKTYTPQQKRALAILILVAILIICATRPEQTNSLIDFALEGILNLFGTLVMLGLSLYVLVLLFSALSPIILPVALLIWLPIAALLGIGGTKDDTSADK
jgi:hypothetical protein